MTFRFLNVTQEIRSATWDQDNSTVLWQYNLHYFDDLNAAGARERDEWHQEALSRWMHDNPVGRGAGWAPYPTSMRIVNWIKWALGRGTVDSAFADSLATQARFLSKRIEYHLLGNHLFANAKALVFAGSFFAGPEAEQWLEKGLAILAREVPEQILRDGGQFERSPMYHSLAFEDVLDLINLSNLFDEPFASKLPSGASTWLSVARSMRLWLRAMTHPDGEIAFFNDAAMGVAPSPSELERYATELGVDLEGCEVPGHIIHLGESGYITGAVSDVAIFMDVGPIGPDYLPGHAHADTLSFELSLFGRRTVVNGGTSRYGLGAERERERGTAAHSTVAVDQADSSEVWGGFRVARRARPFDLKVAAQGQEIRVSCAHDGYRRLPGRPVHRRSWALRPGSVEVTDQVAGAFQSAIARFHLHPDVACRVESEYSGTLHLPRGKQVHWQVTGGSPRLESSVYSPEFGRSLVTQCLAVSFTGADPVTMQFAW